MAGCEWGRDCWAEMYKYRNLSYRLNQGYWEAMVDWVRDTYKEFKNPKLKEDRLRAEKEEAEKKEEKRKKKQKEDEEAAKKKEKKAEEDKKKD